jgi:hypothetical protein
MQEYEMHFLLGIVVVKAQMVSHSVYVTIESDGFTVLVWVVCLVTAVTATRLQLARPVGVILEAAWAARLKHHMS